MEIPIIRIEIAQVPLGKRILEVGNVMSHYDPIHHEVIDKYEKSPHARNIDVVEFRPEEKYDLIISISTLEHVGWDEVPREPDKVLRAIEHLRTLLKPAGKLVATIPLGYNEFLDSKLQEGAIFDQAFFLERTSEFNSWREVGRSSLETAKYNEPFPGANILLVGVITGS